MLTAVGMNVHTVGVSLDIVCVDDAGPDATHRLFWASTMLAFGFYGSNNDATRHFFWRRQRLLGSEALLLTTTSPMPYAIC